MISPERRDNNTTLISETQNYKNDLLNMQQPKSQFTNYKSALDDLKKERGAAYQSYSRNRKNKKRTKTSDKLISIDN